MFRPPSPPCHPLLARCRRQTHRRQPSASSSGRSFNAGPSPAPQPGPSLPRQVGSFYRNAPIEQYAAKPSSTFSLRQLVFFGKGIRAGLDGAEERLIRGGNFVRAELPVRLAHRVRDLQELPFVVNMHPSMAECYRLYVDAFERIRTFPVIKNLEDNDRFCAFMSQRLDEHRVIIPHLAIGLAESASHLSPAGLDMFMTRMLRSRLSRRVLTEQHVALTSQYRASDPSEKHAKRRRVGIVDTELSPVQAVEKCGKLVEHRLGWKVPIVVDGAIDQHFAYIPDHLEYMVFELLKNSAHATLAHHASPSSSSSPIPPIRATIASSPSTLTIRISDQGGGVSFPARSSFPNPVSPTSAFACAKPGDPNSVAAPVPTSRPHFGSSVGHWEVKSTAARREVFSFAKMVSGSAVQCPEAQCDFLTALKCLGRKGLSGTVAEQVREAQEVAQWDAAEGLSGRPGSGDVYGETGQREEQGLKREGDGGKESAARVAARLGIGLPLSSIFAQYFGGSLEMYSVDGYGADTYLRIPRLGDVIEAAW